MSNDIFVLAEHHAGALADTTSELLGKAAGLAAESGGRSVACLLGLGSRGLAEGLAADAVLSVDDPALERFVPEAYVATLAELVAERDPRLVLIANSTVGMDVAGALSARTGRPLVAYCTDLALEGDSTVATSQVYGGKLDAEVVVDAPAIASVVAGSFAPATGGSPTVHGRAYPDTLDITRRITSNVRAPLSLLVAPPTLNERRLQAFKDAGADMIGIGLDAVTEDLFRSLRTEVPKGGLKWHQYWRIVDAARDIFGPWKVNCHTLVGLGETDADLMAIFGRLLDRQIFSYLFCFNPEPDSRIGNRPKTPLRRWRRIQLAKFLLEERGLDPSAFRFDDAGALVRIHAPSELVEEVVDDGHAFMTNGCPSTGGEPGCTRPMGSWRPTEDPRDFPWRPTSAETSVIRDVLDLDDLVRPGSGPTRPPELCAPPAAGRVPDEIGGERR